MKKYLKIVKLLSLTMILLLSACTSYKYVPYMQNSSEVDLTPAKQLFDLKLKPKDQLTIVVNNAIEPEAVKQFDLTISGRNTVNSSTDQQLNSYSSIMAYTVDNEGCIDFPVLGRLHVAGMTKTQLEDYVANLISPKYTFEKPLVVVTLQNYKVSVIGEVNRPGIYTSTNGKMNILEALAQAGDLTIYGRRDCVKVIREEADGEKKIKEIDLNDANFINSDFYQLQQNDIVMVTPNKAKAKSAGIGAETSLWFTSTSILISLASLIINVFR